MTPDELRRKIAEALGWRCDTRTLSHSGELEWRVLLRPDGTVFETEDEHLPRLFPNDPNADRYLFEWCPDWPGSVDAALSLITPDLTLALENCGDEWSAIVENVMMEWDAEPALAICRAWLAWKEAQP